MKYQQIPKPIENSPGETFLFKAGTNISAGFTQIWGIYHGHPPNDNMETILNKGPDGSVSFTVKDLNHPNAPPRTVEYEKDQVPPVLEGLIDNLSKTFMKYYPSGNVNFPPAGAQESGNSAPKNVQAGELKNLADIPQGGGRHRLRAIHSAAPEPADNSRAARHGSGQHAKHTHSAQPQLP